MLEHIVFAEEEAVPVDGALVAGRPHALQYMPNALLLRAIGVPWQLLVGELPILPDHSTDRRGLFILNPFAEEPRTFKSALSQSIEGNLHSSDESAVSYRTC